MPRKVNDDCEHERMLADFLPALKGTYRHESAQIQPHWNLDVNSVHLRLAHFECSLFNANLVTSYYFNIVKYDGYDVTQSFS